LVFCIGVVGEGVSRLIWAHREMFKILNRPDIYPKSIMINLLFALICYPLGAMQGLIVFCIVRAINDWLYAAVQLKLAVKILGFKIMDFIRLSFPSIICSFATAAVIIILIIILKFCAIKITVIPTLFIVCFSIISYILLFRRINRNDYEILLSELKVIIGLS